MAVYRRRAICLATFWVGGGGVLLTTSTVLYCQETLSLK